MSHRGHWKLEICYRRYCSQLLEPKSNLEDILYARISYVNGNLLAIVTYEENIHPKVAPALPLLIPRAHQITLGLWPLEPPPGLQLAAEALNPVLHPGVPVPLRLALSDAPLGMVVLVVGKEQVRQEPVGGVYVAAKVVV